MGDYHSELIKLAGRLYGAYEKVQGNDVEQGKTISGGEVSCRERESDKMSEELAKPSEDTRIPPKTVTGLPNGD